MKMKLEKDNGSRKHWFEEDKINKNKMSENNSKERKKLSQGKLTLKPNLNQ